jgi:hypothetical protein
MEIAALIVGLLRVGVDAWQAFITEGEEAALKVLDAGLKEGRRVVAELRAKLAGNDKAADAKLEKKFPEEPTPVEKFPAATAVLADDDGGASER